MGNRKILGKVLIFVGVLIVAGAVYLYLLIEQAGDMWPHYRVSGSLTAKVAALQSEIEHLRLEVAKIPDAKERLDLVRVDYDLASRVVPRKSGYDNLIDAIKSKAQQAGVILSNLTPSIGQGPGALEAWNFTLQIRGSYDQIATFINSMEEFESQSVANSGGEKQFFQVNSISIQAESSGLAELNEGAVNRPPDQRGHLCTLAMQTFRYTGS